MCSHAYYRKNLRRKLARQQTINRSVRDCATTVGCVGQDVLHIDELPRNQNKERCRRVLSTSIKIGLLNAQSIGNKSTTISSIIDEGNYDLFLLAETWHSSSEDVALSRCVPDGFSCIDAPRPISSDKLLRTNHGGVTMIITDEVNHKVIPQPFKPKTFESVCCSISSCSATVVVLLIYRPGSQPITDLFFIELTRYLESIAVVKCQIVIAGDLNIHVERTENDTTKRLLDILAGFDCVQHVQGAPTHREGGTLDLVITKSNEAIEGLEIDPPDVISDHSLISWRLLMHKHPPIVFQRESRSWKKMDHEAFRAEITQYAIVL